ncbi:MAG: ABC transporter substrate-binding protein [Actinomycetota bacterium]|nr:ABC transporter substrate-binding protein [Actinomycetota bacterium]
MKLRRFRLSLVALVIASLAGCTSTAAHRAFNEDRDPITIENCGAQVTFDTSPQRVVLLRSGAVPFLHALGVMDRVVARAGQYPHEYYDQTTIAELDRIPLLTEKVDSSGHLQISAETVIAQTPDLVLGMNDTLPREKLAAFGIPLLEEPALCGVAGSVPAFDDIYEQLRVYGDVFDRREEAERAAALWEAEYDEIVGGAAGTQLTGAVLFPTVGGGVTYAYGSGSMATAQLEAAGIDNVFSDVSERVFEVTAEELLTRDPDVLVLLHSDGEPEAVVDAIERVPGTSQLSAVRSGRVMTLLFNFVEPATPLTIDGLRAIVDRFGGVDPW